MKPQPVTKMRRRRTSRASGADWKRPPPVAEKLKLSPDVHRRLVNWAQWRSGGMSIGMAVAYQSLESVFRGGGQLAEEERPKPVPVITAEAEEMERAIKALPVEWCTALVVWWTKGGSMQAKASMCGCRKTTMIERIELAHRSIERLFS